MHFLILLASEGRCVQTPKVGQEAMLISWRDRCASSGEKKEILCAFIYHMSSGVITWVQHYFLIWLCRQKKPTKYGMVGMFISSLVCNFIPVQNHDTRFARVNVISDLFRYSQTLNFDLGRDWRVRPICG